jgi:hypothetical protein
MMNISELDAMHENVGRNVKCKSWIVTMPKELFIYFKNKINNKRRNLLGVKYDTYSDSDLFSRIIDGFCHGTWNRKGNLEKVNNIEILRGVKTVEANIVSIKNGSKYYALTTIVNHNEFEVIGETGTKYQIIFEDGTLFIPKEDCIVLS